MYSEARFVISIPTLTLETMRECIKAAGDVLVTGVFYTDGGCKPSSNGIGGVGIHGYLCTPTPPKRGHGVPGAINKADGYENGGALAEACTVLGYIDAHKTLAVPSTNNEAELAALLNVLLIIKQLELRAVQIIMDSMYVLDGALKHRHKQRANKWRTVQGEDISNKDLWIAVDVLLEELKLTGMTLNCKWTKGHSDSLGNNTADVSASLAVISGGNRVDTEEFEWAPPEGYWTATSSTPVLFHQANWYAASRRLLEPLRGYWRYYTGYHDNSDELLGMAMSTGSYTVVHSPEPVTILNDVQRLCAAVIGNHVSELMACKLEVVFKPQVVELLKQGPHYFRTGDHRLDVFTPSSHLLNRHIHPPRLSNNAIVASDCLDAILERFREGKMRAGYHVTDVTDKLYGLKPPKSEKAKPVPGLIIADTDTTTLDAGYICADGSIGVTPIKLVHGIDIQRYRHLVKLAGLEPQVWVLTWPESEIAVRFATITRVGNDYALTAGYYSNIHLLTNP